MGEERSASFLKLVYDSGEHSAPAETIRLEPIQASLLGETSSTVFVCATEALEERGFVELITGLRARLAVDLRVSPRFDFGSLNRRRAFGLFEAFSVRYRDLGPKENSIEECLNVLGSLNNVELRESPDATEHSNVVVFVDAKPDYRELGIAIGRHFRLLTGSDWEIVLRGPSESAKPSRRVVFISHANPEDNPFALWLVAQLQRLGYEVWTDLTRLKGGELHWDSIEKAIRNESVRVIAILSQASVKKDGVLDEIALAVNVERSERISGFVIPVRIDDTPFASLRANIARKNVLDFSKGWAQGLSTLISTLRRDGVPRAGGFPIDEVLPLVGDVRGTALTEKPELLLSNRLRLVRLPERIFYLHGTPTFRVATDVAPDPLPTPITPFRGGWLSFYSSTELKQFRLFGLDIQNVIATDEFHRGNASITSHLRPLECDRLMNRAINAQLIWAFLQRGLQVVANSRPPTLYVPTGLIEKDQVTFVDVDEKSHRRLLVGRSEKRSLFWHLGFTAQSLVAVGAIQLRLRVLFSRDGARDLIPTHRMQDARRSFCKNWWNDRWRSLELALLSWMANGTDTICIHEGDGGKLLLARQPEGFTVPHSLSEFPTPESVEAFDEDIGIDALDSGEWSEYPADEFDDDLESQ